jgi:type II secretory pathway component GspD/PulD (secretin)
MKTHLRGLWLIVTATSFCGPVANGQEQGNKPAQSSVPVIQMQDVPLTMVIENLGRQAGTNFMIDPRITDDGRGNTPVTLRWENMTAMDALARLLKERGLFIVENPQTRVVKITVTNSPPRVFEKELLDSSKDVIPLIQMMDVPLDAALANLAKQAKVELKLDGKLSDPSKPIGGQLSVSLRFENLTAAQALAAICDVYDLQITKSEPAGVWRVSRGK